MREVRTKEIDGHEWQLRALGSKRGMRLFTRLGAVLAPVMTRLAGARDEQDVSSMADAAKELFGKLNEEEMDHFIAELLLGGELERDGAPIFKPATFDDEMAGKPMLVFKLLWFSVELNYGDFADAVQGWAGAWAAKAVSPSAESKT